MRIAAGLAAAAAAVVLFVVLKGGGDQEGKPAVTVIAVGKGGPVGGVRTLDHTVGDEVRLAVTSDVADEVHIHGYDLSKEVPAGGRADFAFRAELEGVFEIELERRQVQLAELRVNPG